jgi:hypothetical protein
MDIDFNNFRLQMAAEMDYLIKKLNDGIDCKSWDANVVVPVREIEKDIESLRQKVWILCCMYDDSGKYKPVWEEVGDITHFNPKEDDN